MNRSARDGRSAWEKWVVVAVAVFATLVLVSAAGASDWPQFLGPTRNGVSPETGLQTAWPHQGPTVAWDKAVGSGYSGPVVAGGRLILLHRQGDEETVECLEAATGKPVWKQAYPTSYRDDFGFDNGPRATPLIGAGAVYTMGADGVLTSLDFASGKLIWQRALNREYQVRKGFFGVGTSPMLEGDLLLVNVGGRNAGIVALDRRTGKEVWKATDHEASYSSPVAATVGGRRLVFFLTREGLAALDPRDGAVRFSKHWRSRSQASVNAASPLVVGDEVFISACYNTGALLLRFDKARADEIWSNDEAMSNHYGTCVYRDGFLYGFDGRQEEGARLRCVEWKTGKVRWTKERFGCGSMILADGHLFIVNEGGELVCVEATPTVYREKARAAVLSSPVRAAIALADGRLYARDGKKIVCWNLKP